MSVLMFLTLLVGSQANPGLFGNSILNTKDMTKMPSTNHIGASDLLDITSIGKGRERKDDNAITSLTDSVKKEAGAVTHTVESTALRTASTQCELLKKVLGVDYSSRSLLKEEDLDQIELEYMAPTKQVIYKISEAAELIAASRDFDPSQPLIIIAHGFITNPDSMAITDLLDALHKKGQYNVLVLDSIRYINWFYLRCTTYVRYIGEKLAGVLAALVHRGLEPNNIHIIGHSLGAQIGGFTGKEFTRLTGEQIGRISGLDPAGPCFFNAGSELRLNATDAAFVDVMHTNHGALGITEPVGHVDFYPNGGAQQPDCVLQACSHNRAWYMFKDSVLYPARFVAVRCDSWNQFRANQCGTEKALMGYPTTPDARGIFFLQTAAGTPYGLGEPGATYTSNEGVINSV